MDFGPVGPKKKLHGPGKPLCPPTLRGTRRRLRSRFRICTSVGRRHAGATVTITNPPPSQADLGLKPSPAGPGWIGMRRPPPPRKFSSFKRAGRTLFEFPEAGGRLLAGSRLVPWRAKAPVAGGGGFPEGVASLYPLTKIEPTRVNPHEVSKYRCLSHTLIGTSDKLGMNFRPTKKLHFVKKGG